MVFIQQLHIESSWVLANFYNQEINYCINYGTTTPHEAAEFVRMCNSTAAKYENLRYAHLGVTDPINIKTWEIGNELAAKWEWHVSWLAGGGHQQIYYQTGVTPTLMFRPLTDSLHYFGGILWRAGWVPEAGDGMDKMSSILGATHVVNATDDDSIVVDIEFAPIYQDSVIVWVVDTSINIALFDDLTQQQIYDLIAQPQHLLDSNYYHTMGDTAVMVYHTPPLDTNMFILVEYKTKHFGTFDIRDSMKAADPSIDIGYCIDFRTNMLGKPSFDARLIQSPPNFLIDHPYNSNIEIAVNKNLFTEILYLAEEKMTHRFPDMQMSLDSIVNALSIPNSIGVGLTEWNIRLCGAGGCNRDYNGILGGLYVANFFLQSYEAERNGSINLKCSDHFAGVAEGTNLIHLFHYYGQTNSVFITPQSEAIRMVNEAVGENYVFIDTAAITGNPKIEVLVETNTTGVFDTLLLPAVRCYGGIDTNTSTFNIVLLNTDDSSDYTININIPPDWLADSAYFEMLSGFPLDSSTFSLDSTYLLTYDTLYGSSNQFTISLDTFSLATVKIPFENIISSISTIEKTSFYAYPNPAKTVTIICSKNKYPYALKLYTITGELIKQINNINTERFSFSVREFEVGVYILKLSNEQDGSEAIKLIIN